MATVRPGQNACEGTKQGAQVSFICPRFMLFSDEMLQAAIDDGNTGMNYAVVGHDADSGGIDGNNGNSCCQCYQLVFSLPENVAQVNGNGASRDSDSAAPGGAVVQHGRGWWQELRHLHGRRRFRRIQRLRSEFVAEEPVGQVPLHAVFHPRASRARAASTRPHRSPAAR